MSGRLLSRVQTLFSALVARNGLLLRRWGARRNCSVHAGRQPPTRQRPRQECAGEETSALGEVTSTPRCSAYKAPQFSDAGSYYFPSFKVS